MGTHGATGAQQVFLGSNTVRVIQRCSTPVLVIPEGCEYNGLDKVAFLSDYLSKVDRASLNSLTNLATKHNTKVEILHMIAEENLSEEQSQNKEALKDLFSNVSHEFVDLKHTNLFSAVQDYANSNEIQLIAMLSKKYSFLERLFTQHNAETFGFKINIPLLVMEDLTPI